MNIFSAEVLNDLVRQARLSPRLRQHLNVHKDYADPSQRLFNAIEPHSYIRPHRHLLDPRDETLIAVRGKLVLVVFDDLGKVTEVVPFGVGRNGSLALGVEVSAGTWHTVVALEPGSVVFEVKAGPFCPDAAKEFAPWAPLEGSESVTGYQDAILSSFGQILGVDFK